MSRVTTPLLTGGSFESQMATLTLTDLNGNFIIFAVVSSNTMHILGLNLYHADASAVLLRDGQLVAALEEERFRRVKHFAGFPSMAIRRCLKIGGIEGENIDAIAISRSPRAHVLRKAAFVIRQRPGRDLLGNRIHHLRRVRDLKNALAESLGVPIERLRKIHFIEHHPAHLAGTFFVSDFDEAAICAVDGFGDFVSTSLAFGRGPPQWRSAGAWRSAELKAKISTLSRSAATPEPTSSGKRRSLSGSGRDATCLETGSITSAGSAT